MHQECVDLALLDSSIYADISVDPVFSTYDYPGFDEASVAIVIYMAIYGDGHKERFTRRDGVTASYI